MLERQMEADRERDQERAWHFEEAMRHEEQRVAELEISHAASLAEMRRLRDACMAEAQRTFEAKWAAEQVR